MNIRQTVKLVSKINFGLLLAFLKILFLEEIAFFVERKFWISYRLFESKIYFGSNDFYFYGYLN